MQVPNDKINDSYTFAIFFDTIQSLLGELAAFKFLPVAGWRVHENAVSALLTNFLSR
jgi:hypothetical protein